MPKCEVDLVLQGRLRLFMSENRLSVSGAAERLGVERSTFWRFCQSGRARGDTRALYREALEKCSSDAVGGVADVADFDTGAAGRALRAGLAGLELRRIRRVCETVLALLDICEAQASGREV